MNRKFILIGLLLGACFAFTVLQVATVEAQQCDASLACDPTTGTCCNQCDPGPACVAGDPHAIPCCSSGGNDMSSGTPPHKEGLRLQSMTKCLMTAMEKTSEKCAH